MALIASIVVLQNPFGLSELSLTLIYGSPTLLCAAGGLHNVLCTRPSRGDVDSRIHAVLLFAASGLVVGAAWILHANAG